MNNSGIALLAAQQRRCDGPQLLVADENLGSAPLHQLQANNLTIVTNRYNLYQIALQEGFNCQFNDFELEAFASGAFEQILFRVAKEKALTHHIINQSRRLLCDNGTLTLMGEKSDGIKTYTEKAGRYLGNPRKPEKHGTLYLAMLQKSDVDSPLLDDNDYRQLRTCIDTEGLMLQSKPGQFGWNKVDQGSALLASLLPDFLANTVEQDSILDLGCGYGYLSCMAAQHCEARIVATDNNAAALLSCRANFSAQEIHGKVIAGNCGDSIAERFDMVLCNPPFHQGFVTDGDLTSQFVASCRRHLKSGGQALFVVNRFVPLESCAEKEKLQVELVAEDRSFKVLRLTLPRH
ncbi:MAG: class I SAM-dependent methyltransferase [Gammaproteobacteria bacterium]|nr:MAG: class I SAM-dependent methyltransferase [Gammaproteobacteria bacterium]